MTQKDRLMDYFSRQDMARAIELRAQGISGVTVARAVAQGDVLRIGRGLYQTPDMEIDAYVNFAEIAKRCPNGVICQVSALEFYGVTNQLPRKVWMAIGARDWACKIDYPPVRIVRFREPYFSGGVETRKISGVTVKIYSLAKSLVDAFRNPRLLHKAVAVESLRNALQERLVTPGNLISMAGQYGVRKIMQPYIEALNYDE